jgi:hypothetical protein
MKTGSHHLLRLKQPNTRVVCSIHSHSRNQSRNSIRSNQTTKHSDEWGGPAKYGWPQPMQSESPTKHILTGSRLPPTKQPRTHPYWGCLQSRPTGEILPTLARYGVHSLLHFALVLFLLRPAAGVCGTARSSGAPPTFCCSAVPRVRGAEEGAIGFFRGAEWIQLFQLHLFCD